MEPWIYPKTKTFKAVVTDKSVFPMLPRLFKKAKNDKNDINEEGGTTKNHNNDNFDNNHDNDNSEIKAKKRVIPPYSDVFRERNMQKVRHLFEKTNVIQTMQWSSNLRHWHPDRIDTKKDSEVAEGNILDKLAKRRNQ